MGVKADDNGVAGRVVRKLVGRCQWWVNLVLGGWGRGGEGGPRQRGGGRRQAWDLAVAALDGRGEEGVQE